MNTRVNSTPPSRASQRPGAPRQGLDHDAQLERIPAALLAGTDEIGRTSPDIVRGYRQLSEDGTKTSRLDPKTRAE